MLHPFIIETLKGGISTFYYLVFDWFNEGFILGETEEKEDLGQVKTPNVDLH